VRIAGRKAGKVEEMTYLGRTGPKNPATQEPALVRVRISVEEAVALSLRRDARFYVTTKGVLGDPYLEIEPGSALEAFDARAIVFGIDPPRLDLFLADGFRLVRGLTSLLERNAENIDQLLGSSSRLLVAVDSYMSDTDTDTEVDKFDQARISRIVDNLEGLLGESRAFVQGAQARFVDDPKIARTVANLEALSGKLNRDIDPLVNDVRRALAVVDRLGDTIGPKEQKALKDALGQLDNIATRADKTMADVDVIVRKMKSGQGTIGQFIMDDEVYDDIKELIRDIKRNPWKLIWQR
jgi:phospholipid/cholesterol/gamma-HCH transport system substrate-binding protein